MVKYFFLSFLWAVMVFEVWDQATGNNAAVTGLRDQPN